ncbi:DUF2723 domain-containing protein [Patescibacteria group bacterium]|nr:DUF2723 domain-containing protein [Patescibacteria group bacterium]
MQIKIKKNTATSFLLGLFVLAIFIFTAPSSIYVGRSGEIVATAYAWGASGSMGFSVYPILGKLFSYLIPFGEFAFKLNIFSAFLGASAISVLFLIFRKLRIDYWAALATALSVAFSSAIWSHSNIAGARPLSALLFVLAILFFLHWLGAKEKKHFFSLRALLWGIPAVACFLGAIAQAGWGESAVQSPSILYALKESAKSLANEFAFFGFLFVLAGMFIAFKRFRGWFFAGLGAILLALVLPAVFKNNIFYVYSLPAVIMMSVFLAFGLDVAVRYLKNSLKIQPLFASLLALLLPVFVFGAHFSDLNRRDYVLLQKTADFILESLPKNSIFITESDTLASAFLYQQSVLGERSDLTLISGKLFSHSWYREEKKIELEAKRKAYADNLFDLAVLNKEGGVFLAHVSLPDLEKNYKLLPAGLVYQVADKDEKESVASVIENNVKFWQAPDFTFLMDAKLDKEILNKELVGLYIMGVNNFGAYLVGRGSMGYVKEGIAYFEKSLEIRENGSALQTLVKIYSALGESEKALEYEQRYRGL